MKTKVLLSSSLLTCLVAGAAIAQPKPTAPRPAGPPMLFELGMTHANDARVYRVLVNQNDCADVTSDDRDRDRNDEVSVCTETAPNGGVLLRTKWKLRAGKFYYETKWSAVVGLGAKVDLDSPGAVRLTLALK